VHPSTQLTPATAQREATRPFLKITVALPNMMSVARGVLEKGMSIPGLACGPLVLPTFESNVLFILRFMVDCKVTGGNWVELPAGAWQNTKRPVSSCQARCRALGLLLACSAA
jgi:DNA polymerase delta subunit 1